MGEFTSDKERLDSMTRDQLMEEIWELEDALEKMWRLKNQYRKIVRANKWMVDFEQSKPGQPDATPYNENIA
jgi:hypothetical protein